MEFKDNDMQDGRLYLYVPYELKDDAKKFGCRWCSEYKSWYITKYVRKTEVDKLLTKYNNMIRVRKYVLQNPDDSDKKDENFKKLFVFISKDDAMKLFEEEQKKEILRHKKEQVTSDIFF